MSNLPVAIRTIVAVLLIYGSAAASAQISGEFYLEKSTYAPGEPVFLYFKLVNIGTEAETIPSADPYSFCSGYQISVSSSPPNTASCGSGLMALDCLSSSAALPPGKPHVERILLNFDNEINAPGEYSVEAVRLLSHAGSSEDYFSSATVKDTLEVRATLHFDVSEQAASAGPGEFQPWVNQLRSTDPAKRIEAARTLASLGPPALEDTLLTFADNPEFQQFAPLAFHRLNTPRSMAAMAELIKKTHAGTAEDMESADYLAESNDLQWFPLLREVAEKNAGIAAYVDDAAKLGGEQMLPTLIALANSPDRQFTAINAVTAMGSTASRAAVPVLLDFLRNPNPDISDRARYALRMLTHRTASADPEGTPQSEYFKWANWWANDGRSAPIHKEGECGDPIPLN